MLSIVSRESGDEKVRVRQPPLNPACSDIKDRKLGRGNPSAAAMIAKMDVKGDGVVQGCRREVLKEIHDFYPGNMLLISKKVDRR